MTFQGPPLEQERDNSGSYGSYVTWHALGSAEHNIPAAQFSLRASGQGNPRMPVPQMATGAVWDIENIETGWQSWPKGGAKDYRANPTMSHPLPFPGAGFTENLRIPILLDANTLVMWDQASAGSWKGFCQIAAVIAQQAPQNPRLLPVIAFTGATLTSTGQNSTQVPNFQIMQWVSQPACLSAPMPAPAPVPPIPAPPPVAIPAAAPQPAQPAPAAAPAAPAAPAGAWN